MIEGGISISVQEEKEEFSFSGAPTVNDTKLLYLALRPRIGFFTSESVMIGIGIDYEQTTFRVEPSFQGTPEPPYGYDLGVVLVNPYLRKFTKLKENFFFTTTVNLAFGLGKRETENSGVTIENKIFDFRLNVSPGLTVLFSDRWGVSGSFGQLHYSYRKETLDTDVGLPEQPENKSNSYGISFQFDTLTIGVQYYFSK